MIAIIGFIVLMIVAVVIIIWGLTLFYVGSKFAPLTWSDMAVFLVVEGLGLAIGYYAWINAPFKMVAA